jgi:hypothetical protein
MTRPDEDPVLPDVTSDERATGWGDESADDDQRLLDDRPPHHEDRD